jgi:hypothetical protein
LPASMDTMLGDLQGTVFSGLVVVSASAFIPKFQLTLLWLSKLFALWRDQLVWGSMACAFRTAQICR